MIVNKVKQGSKKKEEKKMEKTYIIRNEDGSIDIHTSVEAYRQALVSWVEEQERAQEVYREAVLSVLTMASGKRFPLPSLIGMALVKLQPSAKEYEKMSKSVEAWIRQNTGEKGSSALLCAQKGKGGGYCLNPGNVEEPTEEPMEETED
jgi:hypothetical protein